nr:MAG TPA: head closure knob [Caudoviricetes sp.]DAV00919.1 MAG TPA: head closure knob [Caudoviricetes sp.]
MARRISPAPQSLEEIAMTLIDSFKEPCVLMEKKRVSDGEGGWTTTWVDGAAFDAAIVRDTTLAARVAEKEGVSNVYTVTTDTNARLEFHDVFKRVSDGQVFRVTSNGDDMRTPDVATFSFEQVSAEEWKLS